MRKLLALAALAALSLPTTATAQLVAFDCFPIGAGQEVPPNGSTGNGFGNAWLHVPTNTLSWNLDYEDLSGAATGAHFHAAPAGSNGGVQISIGTANPNAGSAVLSAAQTADVLSGNWYVNVHTSANPGGEIRGQLVAGTCVERMEGFGMDQAQEVPPTGSPGTGTGSVWLNHSNNQLRWSIEYAGLIGAIFSAHLHGPAAPGANGGIQVVMNGTNPESGGAVLTNGQVADLLAGLYYSNVHTAGFGGGEIRGQVVDASPAQWVDLGAGKPGTHGTPALMGAGSLTAGSSNEVVVMNGLPGAQGALILGFTNASLPFSFGTLVPSPDILLQPLFLDGDGSLSLPFTWPAGVPIGVSTYAQHWIVDAGAKGGRAASNGLELIAQ
jgi:hypothetical protein